MDRTGWYALARRGELEEGDTRDVRVWGRDYTLTLRDGEPVVFDAEGRRPNAKFMVGWIAVSMFGELNDPVWPHPLSPHDGWGRAALAWIEENAEDAFGELLRACQGIDLRTRDLERVRARLEPRALAVRRTLNAFLQAVIPRCDLLVPLRKELQVRDAESGPQGWYASHVVLNHNIEWHNRRTLGGLLLAASYVLEPETSRVLGDLARRCYVHVPNLGPAAQYLGRCVTFALAHGDLEACRALLEVTPTFRTAGPQRMAGVAAWRQAEALGVTGKAVVDDLVPFHGLDEHGRFARTLGEVTFSIVVDGGGVETTWRRGSRKPTKGAPKALREAHPEEVRELQALGRAVQKTYAHCLEVLARDPDPLPEGRVTLRAGHPIWAAVLAAEVPEETEVAEPIDLEEVLASVYASPDDDGPRLVLADLLQEAGDPRGAFIVKQISKPGARGTKSLVKKHLADWLGDLEPGVARSSVVFERGFPARVELKRHTRLPRTRAWRTVTTILAPLHQLNALGALAEEGLLPSLRTLVPLWKAREPRLSVEMLAPFRMLQTLDLRRSAPSAELIPQLEMPHVLWSAYDVRVLQDAVAESIGCFELHCHGWVFTLENDEVVARLSEAPKDVTADVALARLLGRLPRSVPFRTEHPEPLPETDAALIRLGRVKPPTPANTFDIF